MVLITPLIRDLAARYGRNVDVLTSGPWSEPLLRGQPGVGDILSVRSRKMPYWLSTDQQRAVRRLRTRGPGPTWFCDAGDAAWPMLERARISRRFVVDVKDHPLLPGEHVTEHWRRLGRIMPPAGVPDGTPAGALPAAGGCCLQVADRQRADLDAWLRARRLPSAPFIAIQAGNKRTMRRGLRRLAVNSKYWPAERWALVLRHLRERQPLHSIVLLGTRPEYALNERLAALANIDRLYNVADDLPIPRLIALLARADGLITVDSGPAHAAAAVGCPQVVLFGKASAALYRPWGSSGADVKLLTGEIDGRPNMMGIDIIDVTSAWDALRLRHDASLSEWPVTCPASPR